MGYRSEIGLCLTKEASFAFEEALFALKGSKVYDEIQEFLDDAEFRLHEESGAVLYAWDWVKWYDHEFEDVIFIMKFINDLEHDDYLFIRVGESNDDTEEQGGFWENPFNMCLHRKISF